MGAGTVYGLRLTETATEKLNDFHVLGESRDI